VIPVKDKSKLHLIKAVGETLIEEGAASGTLPGRVRIQLNLNVEELTATSRFTLYVHGGTLTGQAAGKATSGHGGWESFSGKMTLSHGTGRYAHASGVGKMYGALYRRNDTLEVQTTGNLHF